MTQTAERTTLTLDPESLAANPWQPRQSIAPADVREIADSIAQIGLLQSPVVRTVGKGKTPKYQIAVGHIRVAAIKLLIGEKKWTGGVPVDVRALTDAEMAIAALEENGKRVGLRPIDEIRSWDKAIREIEEITVTELGKRIGLDHSTISSAIAVLSLPKAVLDVVDAGDMAIHAAREFLALQVEKNVRADVMKAVITGIREQAEFHHVGTDFKTPNVRRLIRDVIQTGGVSDYYGRRARMTVGDWRPLDDAKDDTPGGAGFGQNQGDYGKNRRSGISFDTQAFVASFPDRVFHVPTYSGGKFTGSRLWTDDAKEWTKWQSAATREKNKAAEAEGKPKTAGTPATRGSTTGATKHKAFESAFDRHPLVVATRPKATTPAVAAANVIGALEERKAVPLTSVGGSKAKDTDNEKAKAHADLHNGLRSYLQARPSRQRLADLLHDITEGFLPAEVTGGEGLSEKEIVRSAASYAKDVQAQVSDALVVAAPGAPTLTKEQRGALGPFGEGLLEYTEYDGKGFHKRVDSMPPWMEDIDECQAHCIIGARLAHMRHHDERDIHLVCTNQKHYEEKLERGKKTYEAVLAKERERDEQLRHTLTESIHPELPTGSMATLFLLTFAGSRGEAINYRLPRGDRDNSQFAYVGAGEQRICEILGVTPEKLDGFGGYWTPRVTTLEHEEIDKVPDEDAQELLTRCLVSWAEERWPLQEVYKHLGIALPAKRAAKREG